MYVIIKHSEWRSVHEADWNWQRRLIEGTILCMDITCLPFNSRQRCGWDKMPKNIISIPFQHFSNNWIQQWRPEYCVRMYCWSRLILGVIRSKFDRYSDEASCPGDYTEKMYWIHERYGNVSAIGSLQVETDGNSFL